jgi:aldehyde:ferredoxin oxidoreductase
MGSKRLKAIVAAATNAVKTAALASVLELTNVFRRCGHL